MINVTVWNEECTGQHFEKIANAVRQEPVSKEDVEWFEKHQGEIKSVYPVGINGQIKSYFENDNEVNVKIATIMDEEQGLSQETIDSTDVLIWWGHQLHDYVSNEVVERVHKAVLGGMGIILLHSAHHSKIFRKITGTSCNLTWRAIGEKERVWTVSPHHPIAKGVPVHFELEHEEMYGEPFGIPNPDEVVFSGWFAGGNLFRSGVTYTRGYGKVFYFQPGHETYKSFYDKNVEQIIKNAVKWVVSDKNQKWDDCPWEQKPLENVPEYTD